MSNSEEQPNVHPHALSVYSKVGYVIVVEYKRLANECIVMLQRATRLSRTESSLDRRMAMIARDEALALEEAANFVQSLGGMIHAASEVQSEKHADPAEDNSAVITRLSPIVQAIYRCYKTRKADQRQASMLSRLDELLAQHEVNNNGNLTTDKDVFAAYNAKYRNDISDYNTYRKAITDLTTYIQESISVNLLTYITDKPSHPWDLLQALRQRLALTDAARTLELEQQYQNLRVTPKTQEIES
ncbi:hypothetical protein GTA08_BOTSDO10080 [Botryosphaeria dothidea]|uniref:Uncharacterized protein n=1 Tax=Botryosphaeria dothidea TaxID=55169 RepID=A0A8H4IJF0_9PEZI|nr:hypothetical protein GTA08_BOTSDO10080 [Botryosphaeria dothidea]